MDGSGSKMGQQPGLRSRAGGLHGALLLLGRLSLPGDERLPVSSASGPWLSMPQISIEPRGARAICLGNLLRQPTLLEGQHVAGAIGNPPDVGRDAGRDLGGIGAQRVDHPAGLVVPVGSSRVNTHPAAGRSSRAMEYRPSDQTPGRQSQSGVASRCRRKSG